MKKEKIVSFIKESNLIEGIYREPTRKEIAEFKRFMALDEITIDDLERFVGVYKPGAKLRITSDLNVEVGGQIKPRGGVGVGYALDVILDNLEENTPYKNHVAYEHLHPFTDGNGRSGRMLWMWQMRSAPLGFLRTFYYQTLSNCN